MRDYLDYRLENKLQAWNGKISDDAVRLSFRANVFRGFATVLLVASLFTVLFFNALFWAGLGWNIATIMVIAAIFLYGISFESARNAAKHVVRQYNFPKTALRYFSNLRLDTFEKSLDLAAKHKRAIIAELKIDTVTHEPDAPVHDVTPTEEIIVVPVTKTAVKRAPAKKAPAKKAAVKSTSTRLK